MTEPWNPVPIESLEDEALANWLKDWLEEIGAPQEAFEAVEELRRRLVQVKKQPPPPPTQFGIYR